MTLKNRTESEHRIRLNRIALIRCGEWWESRKSQEKIPKETPKAVAPDNKLPKPPDFGHYSIEGKVALSNELSPQLYSNARFAIPNVTSAPATRMPLVPNAAGDHKPEATTGLPRQLHHD